jgi:hypothetical protein
MHALSAARRRYKMEFADHSTMEGRWVTDVVTLGDKDSQGHGGSKLSSASVNVTFAELSNMGFIFKYGPFDGVLGLAPRSTAVHLLHLHKNIDKKE